MQERCSFSKVDDNKRCGHGMKTKDNINFALHLLLTGFLSINVVNIVMSRYNKATDLINVRCIVSNSKDAAATTTTMKKK